MKDREQFYDITIAPALRAVAGICQRERIPFFASVQYSQDGNRQTRVTPPEAPFAHHMLLLFARHAPSVDNFLLHLGPLARSAGVDLSGSAFVTAMRTLTDDDQAEQIIRMAVRALEYHQEQTRPIAGTSEAIGAAMTWLAARQRATHAIGKEPPVRLDSEQIQHLIEMQADIASIVAATEEASLEANRRQRARDNNEAAARYRFLCNLSPDAFAEVKKRAKLGEETMDQIVDALRGWI